MGHAPFTTTASTPKSSTSTSNVVIQGAGPAGCFAAMRAAREGARVSLIERSQHPRHKVCGEFISPEIIPLLEAAGALDAFEAAKPFRVRRLSIHLGKRHKEAKLPEPAYGLSRHAFDDLLWQSALAAGATQIEAGSEPTVIATGRGSRATGDRLFGFKAHFDGPTDDAVELYFSRTAYLGINCIEGGRTNICGLAPESTLRGVGFEPDALLPRDRTSPLTRRMDWLFTGPLVFQQAWQDTAALRCGDALSFVDPFTGSGLLCAAVTGSLAGVHAARGMGVGDHLAACRKAIGSPFLISSALRSAVRNEWASHLLPFVPARALYWLTRPGLLRK